MAKSNSPAPIDTVIGKPSMRMRVPIMVWCRANGHNIDDGRFFYDGPVGLNPNQRIMDQTAAELGMDGYQGPYDIRVKSLLISVELISPNYDDMYTIRMDIRDKMKVYMTGFCERNYTHSIDDVSFLYGGNVIREDQTPESLGMQDGDAILVEKLLLALKVVAPDGEEDFLEIKRTSKLKGLMWHWCSQRQYEMEHVRFLFDGERVGEDQTPHELGIDDFDSLEVSFHHDYKHLACLD